MILCAFVRLVHLDVLKAPRGGNQSLGEGKYQSTVCKLELEMNTFQDMKMGPTGHWKPSEAGFLTSTATVMQLQAELFDNQSYKSLLTGRLTQNCIDNVFFAVRMEKPVPSEYDFRCTLCLICISHFPHTPWTFSHGTDYGEYRVDFLLAQSHLSAADDTSDELEEILLEVLTNEKRDILAYMAGHLLKIILITVGYTTCTTVLAATLNGEHLKLLKLNNITVEEKLTYSIDIVMKFPLESEEQFKERSVWNDILSRSSPLKSVLLVLKRNSSVDLGTFTPHK